MKPLEVNRMTKALLSQVRQGKVEPLLDDVGPEAAVRNYAWMVRHGAVPGSYHCSQAVQVARYREAQARNSATDSAVRDPLTTLGTRTSEFFWYFAFSRRLDRLSRTYSQKTLEIACLGLIDLWEFRGLDPDVMRTVALCVFSIVLPQQVQERSFAAACPRHAALQDDRWAVGCIGGET
jgi:hypothetical protein